MRVTQAISLAVLAVQQVACRPPPVAEWPSIANQAMKNASSDSLLSTAPKLADDSLDSKQGVQEKELEKRDSQEAYPRLQALPGNASKAALTFQPLMDFSRESCYNAPAIDPHGNLDTGLPNWKTTRSKGCRNPASLRRENNNVYVRRRCNHGWCAWMYEYYFPKDVVVEHVIDLVGHRYDWENIVVWTSDPTPSKNNGTGELDLSKWQRRYVATFDTFEGMYRVGRPDTVLSSGTHPLVVYERDKQWTHFTRAAYQRDMVVKNHAKHWIQGTLVEYDGFPKGIRDKLFEKDWGAVNIAMMDRRFADRLWNAAPPPAIDDAFDHKYDAYPEIPQSA